MKDERTCTMRREVEDAKPQNSDPHSEAVTEPLNVVHIVCVPRPFEQK